MDENAGFQQGRDDLMPEGAVRRQAAAAGGHPSEISIPRVSARLQDAKQCHRPEQTEFRNVAQGWSQDCILGHSAHRALPLAGKADFGLFRIGL